MAKFLGLRGLGLKTAMVVLVVLPSFMLFGWNNGSTGHATDLESFVKVNTLQAIVWGWNLTDY
jgi:hypothetical protein